MAFKKGMISVKFRFEHHFIDRNMPGKRYGQAALADVDGDDALEFITGQQFGDIFWYDYEDPDHWTRYLLGSESPSDVGACAIDVDNDGWVDLVTGGAWYRNSRDPCSKPFRKYVFDKIPSVHDVVAADIDGDGQLEIVTMSDKTNVRWYKIPVEPTSLWEKHDVGPPVHAGISVGDIDGDGDLDIVRSNVWFENVEGDGTRWVEHPIDSFGAPQETAAFSWMVNATKSVVCDINGDGYNDIVVTDAEIRGARVYWMENVDGSGLAWKRHTLPHNDNVKRGAYHSLNVADFDGDSDLDVFTCEMEGGGSKAITGELQPRFYIWENVDGKGNFIEHVILDVGLGGHEAVVGDITGNGKLDICFKPWEPRPDNANNGRMHADFLENLS